MEESSGNVPNNNISEDKVEKLKERLDALSLGGDAKSGDKASNGLTPKDATSSTPPEERKKERSFWNTQPVSQLEDESSDDKFGPVDANTDVGRIRKRPYALPDAFEWVDVDVDDEADMSQLYTLLKENYVEDDDSLFRFDYKPEFLHWAMTPPGHKKEWHIGVRVKSSKRLVGYISGVPAKVKFCGTDVSAAEVNFLCVHKKLRFKRLAPVLIREVTRRVNLCGIWQAVYTGGTIIQKPVSSCTYWHRPLDIKKLVNAKFSAIGNRMTIARAQRLYRIPAEVDSISMRPMERRDAKAVLTLLTNYLPTYKLYPLYTLEDVEHYFLPKENIMYSYVLSKEDGTITDFISFYCLESAIIHNPKLGNLRAAYAYYNIATTIPYKALMNKALKYAHENGFEVFNALDMMNNQEIFKDLKFGDGDGCLHYYIYNWHTPSLKPYEIGIVMP
ncbi:glycylpeptide N-tetradecanoyltransferase [Babesia gibsoni]|uniref:Glycylpeptide N-tetradecanoyltransferase n=1 Tax=Babesia gibsoni TaxID=33632 RepID=A0AAD8PEQ1_BABGI|nr:glycylpeptide N-tetradecanoyltransferase [Babesia gibsoni]